MRNIFLILFLLTAGVFMSKSSAQAIILRSDTLEVPCTATDTVFVPVYLDNFTNVSGLQFTLQWDSSQLDYVSISMINPQFLGIGFDTSAASITSGFLTFAWTDLAGLSLPPNTVLFKVAFARIGGPASPIAFIDDPTAVAAYDNQFNQIPIETHNGLIKPIDDIGPTITCPGFVVEGGSGPTPIPNIPPVVSDNCGIATTGWSVAGATTGNFPNDPDASGALFNIGFSTVTYTTKDVGGNTATCSFDVLIEFSVTTTDLTLIANPNNLASCGQTVSIDILAFNFDTISGLQFSMEWLPDNLEFVSVTNTNAAIGITPGNLNQDSTGVGLLSFAWTTPSFPGSTLPAGEALFTLTFNVMGSGVLAFGNNPTQSIAFEGFPPEETTLVTLNGNIFVTDTVAPVLTCPDNLTVTAPGATTVPGINPTVSDNCATPDISWTVSGATTGSFPNDADASDNLFNLGSNQVTYTATDDGGNTASCSFNVTVDFGINSSDLTIVANSANAACGNGFSIDVTAFNFETVAGVQFTLNWDPALYQYTSVSNFNLPLGVAVSNFGIDSTGVGFITFAWTGPGLSGLTINDGDTLFRLNFTLLNNTSSSIVFGDDPTVRVAYDGGTLDEIPMMTIDGIVSVLDNVPPTLVCPASVAVDAPQGQLFATVNGLEPTTLSDNCGGVPGLTYTSTGTTPHTQTSGNANGDFNAGTTTVVYTATDSNGNSATCSFDVVVDAGIPVVLQLDTVDLGCQGIPTQVTVHLTVENFIDVVGLQFGLNWDPLVLEIVPPVDIDYIQTVPPPIFVDQSTGTLSFFGGNPGWPDVPNDSTVLTLTFNVLIPGALSTTQIGFVGPFDALDPNFESLPVQTIDGAFIFNLDNVPPVVTCPKDTIVNALPQQCTATYVPVAPVATDACGAVDSISIFPDTTIFGAGLPTVLTYTVSDAAGNSTTCSFTVTVFENNPPQIVTCPSSPIMVEATGPLCQATATWDVPTFKDTCSQTANLVITNDYDPGGLFSLGKTLVNYTAKDLSGNETTCSFEVMVVDLTPPSITCPKDTVITPVNGCSAVVDFADPVAVDNCDQDLTVICSDTSGTTFSGVTTVTCAVLDDSDNAAQCTFTVTIIDGLAPTFPNGCPANVNVVSAAGNCGANPTWQAPAVMDNCDQSVSLMPSQASGSFFDVQNSPHTVTYTATDDMFNTTTCTFTVTVADTTKPVLSNCPQPIIKVLPIDSCTITLSWTLPTVADNCGTGAVTLSSNLQPGLFVTGDTVVVYTATDASNNTATCSFLVSISDVVPPVIDCPTTPIPVLVPSPCGVVPAWTLPAASDNCTPLSGLVYTSDYLPGDTFDVGTTNFIVRVTDASGNFVECTMTVVNNVTPRFTQIPDTIFVFQCDPVVTWTAPVPVDFCPPVLITASIQPGSPFPFGATTVIYTATDTLGNQATASFVVVVSETQAPVFTCPTSPIVINIGGEILSDPSNFLLTADTSSDCRGARVTFNLPNATDNCVTPTVTQDQGPLSGTVFQQGFNDLIFKAVDSSGNMSQCAVFVEVKELDALTPQVNPVPACAGDEVVITATNISGAVYTWTGPGSSSTNVLTIGSLSNQNDGVYLVSANVNGCVTGPDTAMVFLTMAPMAENDLDYSIDPGTTITFPSVLTNDLLSPAFDFEICEVSVLGGLIMNNTDGTFTYTAGETPGMVSFIYRVCSKTCELDDQAAVTIRINDTKCTFIPNIITPNGDDANDWFTVPCLETGLFLENSLVVYNQWGDKVYEAAPYSNDPAEAWRGTLDGEPGKDLPDGVYFYIFKPGPNAPPRKGFVEIFR